MVETQRTKDLRNVKKLANLRITLQRKLESLRKELAAAAAEVSVPSFVGAQPQQRGKDEIEANIRRVEQELEEVEVSEHLGWRLFRVWHHSPSWCVIGRKRPGAGKAITCRGPLMSLAS